MATAAQIEANRRNAQRSTGPKTARGKARVRRNALKHGMYARKAMPVLPQEDPRELEERTQAYLGDLQPRNAIEHDLVRHAARLSYTIERAERIETAHRAARVREAMRPELGTKQFEQVRELGRRLLYIVGPGDKSYPQAPFNDDPAVFVHGLEETAEGCRWLLERWAEYRTLLETRQSYWNIPAKVRFIRLQGKQPVEAFYDPWLNQIFLAWEVLSPKTCEHFWFLYNKSPSLVDPAYQHLLYWEPLVERPQDKTEAWTVLEDVVNEHVERLESLLAEHEAISEEEAADRADLAAFDGSKEFDRHRRYQSARTRELLRTLDTLRKMRKEEFGMGNEEEEMTENEWERADGDRSEAEGEPEIEDEPCEVTVGGCEQGQSDELTLAGRDAADLPNPGDHVRKSMPGDLKSSRKRRSKPIRGRGKGRKSKKLRHCRPERPGRIKANALKTGTGRKGHAKADSSASVNGEGWPLTWGEGRETPSDGEKVSSR